jgi:hypothetical protein
MGVVNGSTTNCYHADEVDFLLEVFRAEIRRQSLPWKVTDKVGVYIGKSPKTGKDYSRTPDVAF